MTKIEHHYAVLGKLRLPNGLYLASTYSDYRYVWIRDCCYMALPYLNKNCDTFERTIWRLLDMLKTYEWKLDIHAQQRPSAMFEYIHSRYYADSVMEMPDEWGHAQHDAIGLLLWCIGEGAKCGKTTVRNDHDLNIVQKLVDYLACCEYWHDPDNGMWEEWREVHSSSVGAVVAGLTSVQHLVNVPSELISNGMNTLHALLPRESVDKPCDLAQLSLIYPFNLPLATRMKELVVSQVEAYLLRDYGVIRYQGDSYYSTISSRDHSRNAYIGTEAQWTFGLPWLSLCHKTLGNDQLAKHYVDRTEVAMLDNFDLPELYYADTKTPGPNTPLGWSSAMYILANV